ncbi:GvpL/GvpF family gas vesicle protein [Krasilnikoviella flava]|uniref:Gas vesicle synthesis protein GvpL/GvpF n=1 Tax=Krasilnikoviella flava TaxID=526729 RepID=A0A1T5L8M0_9MICO|nr:GvpL/GvpF family gas vesicle protein [Krasilnikoviella flava]SKC72045.1 Gas vesicle synthesis protein GvpL/GvpF [Krasilnikoviella flava]
MTPATTEGLYLYAVTAGGAEGDLGTGIDDARLHRVSARDLAAVVHRHTSGPYGGADEDVRRRVVEHSEVVDRLWQAGAVLPVSFNVIVAGNAQAPARRQVAGWLDRHAPRLTARLDQVTGRGELQVEIGLEQHEAAAGDPRVLALRAELEERPAGVRRLMTKRLEQLERDATAALAGDLYPELRRRLVATAPDIAENRRMHPERGVVPVLGLSLLVPLDQVDQVGIELSRIRAELPAVRIRYVGPWPPYSFADLPGTTST